MAQTCTSGDLATTCTVSDTQVWQGSVSLNNLVVTGSIVTNGAGLAITASGSVTGVGMISTEGAVAGGNLLLRASGPVSLGAVSADGHGGLGPGGSITLLAPSTSVPSIHANGGASTSGAAGGAITVDHLAGPATVSAVGGSAPFWATAPDNSGGNGGPVALTNASGALDIRTTGGYGGGYYGPGAGGAVSVSGATLSLSIHTNSGDTSSSINFGGNFHAGAVSVSGGNVTLTRVSFSGGNLVQTGGVVNFVGAGALLSLDAQNLVVAGPVTTSLGNAWTGTGGSVSLRTSGISLQAGVSALTGSGGYCFALPGNSLNNWVIGGVPADPSLRQDPDLCVARAYPVLINSTVDSVREAAARSPSRLRPRLEVQKAFTVNGSPVTQVRAGDLLDVGVTLRNPIPPELDGRARMANISLQEMLPGGAEVVAGTPGANFSQLRAGESAAYNYTLRVPAGLGALPLRTEGTYDWVDMNGLNLSGTFGSDPTPFSAGCLAYVSVTGTYDSDGEVLASGLFDAAARNDALTGTDRVDFTDRLNDLIRQLQLPLRGTKCIHHTTLDDFSKGSHAGTRAVPLGDGAVQLLPSGGIGTYTSPVLQDPNGTVVQWGRVSWTPDLPDPANTSAALQIRTGNTSVPDGTWTPFLDYTLSSGEPVRNPPSRYLQYRILLAAPGAPPLALWHMNEGSGAAAFDASGSGNTLLLEPGVGWNNATSKFGSSALDFPGQGTGASAPGNGTLDLRGPFTLEAWVNLRGYDYPTSGGEAWIAGKLWPGGGYGIFYYGGSLYFRATDGGGRPVDAVRPGLDSLHTWHHLALVYDGAEVRGYVDGVLAASAPLSGPLLSQPDAPFLLGRLAGDPTRFRLSGLIDEVRVVDGARYSGPRFDPPDAEFAAPLPGAPAPPPAVEEVTIDYGLSPCSRVGFHFDDATGLCVAPLRATSATPGTLVLSNLSIRSAAAHANVTAFPSGGSEARLAFPAAGRALSEIGFPLAPVESATLDARGEASGAPSGDARTLALYHFNEGSGPTASDASGNGNTLLLEPGVGWNHATPAFGTSALDFPGSGGASGPGTGPLDLRGPFTLEAWVNIRAYDYGIYGEKYREAWIAGKQAGGRGGYGIFYYGGSLDFRVTSATGAVVDAVRPGLDSLNTWHHLALVYDGAEVRGYVDGARVASAPLSGPLEPTTDPFFLGRFPGDPTRFRLNGSLDEVRVSDVARYSGPSFTLPAGEFPGLSGGPSYPTRPALDVGADGTVEWTHGAVEMDAPPGARDPRLSFTGVPGPLPAFNPSVSVNGNFSSVRGALGGGQSARIPVPLAPGRNSLFFDAGGSGKFSWELRATRDRPVEFPQEPVRPLLVLTGDSKDGVPAVNPSVTLNGRRFQVDGALSPGQTARFDISSALRNGSNEFVPDVSGSTDLALYTTGNPTLSGQPLCDSGDLDTACTLTRAHLLTSPLRIRGHVVDVAPGGNLTSVSVLSLQAPQVRVEAGGALGAASLRLVAPDSLQVDGTLTAGPGSLVAAASITVSSSGTIALPPGTLPLTLNTTGDLVVDGRIAGPGSVAVNVGGSVRGSGSIALDGSSPGLSGGSFDLRANGPIALRAVSANGAPGGSAYPCSGPGAGGSVAISGSSVSIPSVQAVGGSSYFYLPCIFNGGNGGAVSIANAVGPMAVAGGGGSGGYAAAGGSGGTISLANASGSFLLDAGGAGGGAYNPDGAGGPGGAIAVSSGAELSVTGGAGGGAGGFAGAGFYCRGGPGGAGGALTLRGRNVTAAGSASGGGYGCGGPQAAGGQVSIDAVNLFTTPALGALSAGSGSATVRTSGILLQAPLSASSGDGRYCAALPGNDFANWAVGGVPMQPDPSLCALQPPAYPPPAPVSVSLPDLSQASPISTVSATDPSGVKTGRFSWEILDGKRASLSVPGFLTEAEVDFERTEPISTSPNGGHGCVEFNFPATPPGCARSVDDPGTHTVVADGVQYLTSVAPAQDQYISKQVGEWPTYYLYSYYQAPDHTHTATVNGYTFQSDTAGAHQHSTIFVYQRTSGYPPVYTNCATVEQPALHNVSYNINTPCYAGDHSHTFRIPPFFGPRVIFGNQTLEAQIRSYQPAAVAKLPSSFTGSIPMVLSFRDPGKATFALRGNLYDLEPERSLDVDVPGVPKDATLTLTGDSLFLPFQSPQTHDSLSGPSNHPGDAVFSLTDPTHAGRVARATLVLRQGETDFNSKSVYVSVDGVSVFRQTFPPGYPLPPGSSPLRIPLDPAGLNGRGSVNVHVDSPQVAFFASLEYTAELQSRNPSANVSGVPAVVSGTLADGQTAVFKTLKLGQGLNRLVFSVDPVGYFIGSPAIPPTAASGKFNWNLKADLVETFNVSRADTLLVEPETAPANLEVPPPVNESPLPSGVVLERVTAGNASAFIRQLTLLLRESAALADETQNATVTQLLQARPELSEREEAVADPSGRFLSTNLTGRLSLVNLEAFRGRGLFDLLLDPATLGNVSGLQARYAVLGLAPGTNPIADYTIAGEPRLRVTETVQDPSFDAYVDARAAEGRLASEAVAGAKAGVKLLFGSENVLRFTLALSNPSNRTLEGVAVASPAPRGAAVANLSGGTYDATNDTLPVGDLGPGENRTVVFEATLPASAFPDPEADEVGLQRNLTVTYRVNASLSGVRASDLLGNPLYLVLPQDPSGETLGNLSLRDPLLDRLPLVKPLRVSTSLDEKVAGLFNASGALNESRASRSGTLTVSNGEPYPGRLGFTVNLNNTAFTSLSANETFPTLLPGVNSRGYFESLGPRARLALQSNTSLAAGLRYLYNETLALRLDLRNPSDAPLAASARLALPDNLTLCCEFTVEPRTPGLAYVEANRTLLWSGALAPGANTSLEARVSLKVTNATFAREGALVLPLEWDVVTEAGKTVSGISVERVVGNDLFLALLENRSEKTIEELSLQETLRIPVLSRLVLAWSTDPANLEFVGAVAAARPDINVTHVSTKADFLAELRTRFYNVLWLANTRVSEDFNDDESGEFTTEHDDASTQLNASEIAEIKALVKGGSPVGRGLIASGFGLKYAPGLGDLLGVKYRGSLPNGHRFEVRPVEVLVDHNITRGLVDQRLEATSWFVRAEATRATVLARLADGVLPGLRLGVPFWQQQLPALSASIYGNGSGVLFAPDTGTTWQRGLSPQEWLNLTLNAIDWIPTAQGAEAALEIDKRLSPDHVTARRNGEGNSEKRVHVNVTLENAGPSDLFDLRAVEALPEGFVLKEGSLNATFASLPSGASASFDYSAEVPASEVADYILNTTVTALDSQGVPHLFSGNTTLKVEMPPGHVCSDPPQPPGQGKGQAKGKSVKCERPMALSVVDSKGGRSDCPPGWLKHGDGVTCVPPGQGGTPPGQGGAPPGGGGGNGNGKGGGH